VTVHGIRSGVSWAMQLKAALAALLGAVTDQYPVIRVCATTSTTRQWGLARPWPQQGRALRGDFNQRGVPASNSLRRHPRRSRHRRRMIRVGGRPDFHFNGAARLDGAEVFLGSALRLRLYLGVTGLMRGAKDVAVRFGAFP